MNFIESEKYLYSLGNEVLAMKLGLENIQTLLGALGNPEKKYFKIQVAGTNGKGSTCAFLEAIALSAKIKVGMTTSPHLVSITERIRIGGHEISRKRFAEYATKIRRLSKNLVREGKLESVPTYFEQVTAIALLAFAEEKVELAILETGLGGRFDATTAARAEVAALTPIDLDHQKILGETLAQIAAEKAAIIRSDSKLISAPQPGEAVEVIKAKCREVVINPIWATTSINTQTSTESGHRLITREFVTEKAIYSRILLGLEGNHQTENAALAIGIAEILQDCGFKISNSDISLGLETARHRGRLEYAGNFLFDGAHNPAGAQALRRYLDEFVKKPVTMIFGAMRDKDLTEIAQRLFPVADKLILTVPNNERSLNVRELLTFVPSDFDRKNLFLTETVGEALALAEKNSTPDDLILVTGSLYLVGEVQKLKSDNQLAKSDGH